MILTPRQPRLKSESGIYHIMLREINGQVIFEDNEDYAKLIETITTYKTICEYKIYAYCLMPNHIHILLKIGKEDLDLILKRIAGSYVYWYNWKYHRKGHLFLDIMSKEEFVQFNNEMNNDTCLDFKDIEFRLNYKEATELIRKITKCTNIREIQNIEVNQRNKCIKKMKDKGISIRQINRITGISIGIIRKC